MASWAAPHVQDPGARPEVEDVREEGDLLRGALGERVAQVRVPCVGSDRLELPAGDLDGR